MKIKLNQKLSLLIFLVYFGLSFGQKVEFTVPKNIEVLESIIFDFENDFTKNSAMDAAATAMGSGFSTNIDLYNLKYDAGSKNPYLELALNKGAKSKQFIQQASWNITFTKISKKSTKVSIFLENITPDRLSKKDVDVKQTKSTGKVEKEIKEFLLNSKATDRATAQAASPRAEEIARMNAEADAQFAEIEARNHIEKTTSKKLQALFTNKQFISLPTTSATFTKRLQIQPTEPECESCKGGKYSNWDIDEVFNLIYATMIDGQEYYALQYYGDKKVAGLPYGLVFNDSSPTECQELFARYNAQLYQTTVDTDENTSSALTVVTFKMNKSFIRLEFGNQYLTRLLVSNREQ
ncbi:hypothetical protein SAMN05421786_10110 [Chryseobacterium ureilyticum]|uniref:DUF4468 domain-containing protein n=1 Tax=Chryseobacterium ureilyticum TaxID=373668 RepID=A0A1N7JS13_9FLAO|nr:hypothetical protein [Chryseobacterium ureilyticum]SIS52026.1 hypothetical protein SAMN05421786_10110 [Chryseobacterium ureilyticum]